MSGIQIHTLLSKCHPEFILQSEKVCQVVSKLDQLSHMNKKQDLLDMELEEAETRYV
jgi:hypothetical protein